MLDRPEKSNLVMVILIIIGFIIALLMLAILTTKYNVNEIDEVYNKLLVAYLLSSMIIINIINKRAKLVIVGLIVINTIYIFDGIEEFPFIPEDSIVDFIEDYISEYIILSGILLISIGYLKEILLHKTKIKQLRNSSLRDPLTNVLNRRALKSIYNNVSHNTSTFCYLDLNKFKEINDNFGHRIGDEILKQFSNVVESHLRKNDKFFRIGGDEFLLVLSTGEDRVVRDVLNRIRKILKSTITEHEIDFSSGFVTRNGKLNIEQILVDADRQMYLDKKANRGLS